MKKPEVKPKEQYPVIDDGLQKQFMRYYALAQRGSRRTEAETIEMMGAQDGLIEDHAAILEKVCRAEIADIELTFEEYEHYGDGGCVYFFKSLDSVLSMTTVPLLHAVNVAEIDRVLHGLYSAMVTVAGKIEELEPVLGRWLKHERKISDTVKAVCSLDKEWQADAIARIAVPSRLYNKVRLLESYCMQFKHRYSALEKAYEIVSRLITVHIDTPAGEFSRSSDPVAMDELSKVSEGVARRAATQTKDISSPVKPTPRMFGQRKA